MNHLKALVLMQLKDKIDFSFTHTKKTLIRKIIFTILRFAVVAALAYIVSMVLELFIFYASDLPNVMTFVLTFLLLATTLTCTIGLVKSLYFAADNRVLITMPVGNAWIFISKIVVYYLYELLRQYMFIFPILLGIGLYMNTIVSPLFIPWMAITMLLVPALPVLIGGILSIPALFIARFVNRVPLLKIILVVAGITAFVWGVVAVIDLIPENIDILNYRPDVKAIIKNFIVDVGKSIPVCGWLVTMFIGVRQPDMTYSLFDWTVPLIFVSMLAIIALLFVVVYFLSKPLFFKMMSKSFEFEKKYTIQRRKNKPHGKVFAFLQKEFKLCILNTEVSMSFLAVYIAVPLLIYLMNSLYAAMNTSLQGDVLSWTFNVLIMLLPMLASNSMISTLYSKEGRAGYMKKTEPVNILFPLISKLFFFLLFSIPSIVGTIVVFGKFYSEIFTWYELVLLALTLLFFQYGHIFFSAMLDVMNPQNEQYATVGESAQNPNENKSTLVAFAISVAVTLFAYLFFNENVFTAVLRLCLIGGVFCFAMIRSFVLNVKAYYYEK